MLSNLGDFIDQLGRAGQLKRVACEVDAELEIAAITARVARDHGPALFFENVRGYRTPVVTNLFGTEERIRLALGVTKLDGALTPPTESQGGWLDKLRGKTPSAESHSPRVVRTAPCQQVVQLGRDVDLAEWPALRAWPAETRRSISAGLLVLPEGGQRVGMQSVAATILDRARLGVLGTIALDQRTPAAIVLGGEPALAVIASPTAQAFATSELAAHWRGRGPDVVACRTHDLLVPAEAEIVIEGFIDPAETMPAPSVAAESGYYATSGSMHAMEVTAVTHRTNPIFPVVVISTPPCESSVVRSVVSRWLRATIEQAVPELVDYSLVTDAGPEQFAVVA
ncbi:MAG TPA: UbiD family decarboxylase domain-containing protein, partial [Pirellulales bacterium]|nr:UbiD family decarboxylase domain-containing protein [Pirellulales bacterium]